MWARAGDLLPRLDPHRLALLPDLGEALRESGEFERARDVLTQGRELAGAEGNTPVEGYCSLELMSLRLQSDPEARTAELSGEAGRLVALYREEGDDAGLVRAYRALAGVSWVECRIEDTAAHLERAAAHARLSGRRSDELDSLAWLGVCYRYGPTPAEEGMRRVGELLTAADGDRGLEASLAVARGGLNAIQGRFDEARASFADARAILADLGMRLVLAATTHAAGRLELFAGDPASAERELRRGYDELKAMGETSFLSSSAALLAEALVVQGRLEEADALADESRTLSAEDDRISQILWRTTRARIRGREGELAEAAGLAREAVELAGSTDFLEERGHAHVALAEVLELAGRPAEARAELDRALELYERKGHEVGAAFVRRRLEPEATAAAS